MFNTVALTVSATSTDGDLTRMDWVLDPGSGGETVVATDSSSPYSQSWTPTGIADGDHTLVARAVRGGTHTDSSPVTLNVGEILHTLVSSVTCLRAWQSDFGVHDAGGGVCDSWTDQKNSTTAVQVTGGLQPAIVANAYGKHTALRFDGSNDLLFESTLDLPAPGTTPTWIYGVFNRKVWDGASSRGVWCAGTTVGVMRLGDNNLTPQMMSYDGTIANRNSGAPENTLVRSLQNFTASIGDYLKLGATLVSGVSTGNSNPAAGWVLGAITNTGTTCSNCDLLACLIFNGEVNASELTALDNAVTAMYPGVSV